MRRDLWQELCSYENLMLAFKKARKHKTTKNYVIEFEKNLEKYKDDINKFLIENLKIELHPEKSKIIKLGRGINLLGYREFYYHKLLRKSPKKKNRRLTKIEEVLG